MKGSTAWYKQKTAELKNILHESKMEFDIQYRMAYNHAQAFKRDMDAIIWAGERSCDRMNGFLNLIEKT